MGENALIIILIGLGVLVLLAGIGFCWAYVPLRKWLATKIDPSWRRLAKVYDFPPEKEAAEEQNLFVSSTVMRDACDIIWHEKEPEPPEVLYQPLPFGTVVHINAKHISAFAEKVLDRLMQPIVLVTGCDTADTNVPGHRRILDSDNVLHWFLQNYALDPKYLGKKATNLPLGFNFHKLEPGGDNTSGEMGFPSRPGNQQLTIKAIRENIPPIAERPARVYANFHLSMDTFLRDPRESQKRYRARRDAIGKLYGKPFVHAQERHLPRNEVWRRHKEFAFELSPHGNGLDAHRTWEAIVLKCIPIVKSSSLDPMYEGLPVVIVEDWNDVTQERLDAWKKKFEEQIEGPIPDKLYSNYWIDRFRRFARAHAEKAGGKPPKAAE